MFRAEKYQNRNSTCPFFNPPDYVEKDNAQAER